MAFDDTDTGASSGGTRIEARCAWCGPVMFDASGLQLHVGGHPAALAEFRCPDCDRVNVRAVAGDDVRALLGAGIKPSFGPAPFELLEEHAGPPIAWDELIEFHEALTRSGRLEGIDDTPGPTGPDRERDAA